jgi:DNA-directed RNA polymerase specialized sigma24 family protein
VTWDSVDDDFRHLAETILTDAELAAYRLHLNGNGYRPIGRILGISTSAARDRVDRARSKLALAQLDETEPA